MDAYQRYGRPPPPPPPQPPPSMAEHHQYQQYQHPPPPPPQAQPWYSSSPPGPPYNNQQQYQTPPQQWGPPPPQPPAPYPLQQQQPYPPPPSLQVYQPPQHYAPPVNQEWGNPNWGMHHQGYPGHANEEDWAGKARAWAAAKAAMDNQHPPPPPPPPSLPQYASVGRPEGQTQFYDQYSHPIDPSHLESQAQLHAQSGYQQYSAPPEPVMHQQESASMSSGQAPYIPDGRPPYFSREGTFAGDASAGFSHQHASSVYSHQDNSTSPSVNQQEVPSSYSTVTGNERAMDRNELPHKSLPLPITSFQEGQQLGQSSVPGFSGPELVKHHFPYGNKTADSNINLADKPLDFVPRFSHSHEAHALSTYPHPDSSGPIRGVDPAASVTSAHSWTPPFAPGGIYPPVPPGHPSGLQHEHSVAAPSSSIFGGISGPSFQSTIPSVSAPFGLGAGTALHSSTTFPIDAYGISNISDRPKKASVPNWLREEIIKKTVLESSGQENTRDETQSIEEESVDKFRGRGDVADNRSVESSRSAEDEDDDEDYVEAAKTAAINQEIKKILTEVLLKVTDDLFDEIATKVLSEDDLTVDAAGDQNAVASNIGTSLSAAAASTPKASARVLVSVKSKESETDDVSEKSSFTSPGDVLGLGSYASDDDDGDGDDEDGIRSPKILHLKDVQKQSTVKKPSEDTDDTVENGKTSSNGLKNNKNATSNVGSALSFKADTRVAEDENSVDEKLHVGINNSNARYNVGGKVTRQTELPSENVSGKFMVTGDSLSGEIRPLSGNKDRFEKDSAITRKDRKEDQYHDKQDEKNLEKEKMDARNGSKDKKKENGAQPEEKSKESNAKKKSSCTDDKEDRKEKDRGEKSSTKEDNGKKREHGKGEKEDRSRHKVSSDSSRHKRGHSPSPTKRTRHKNDISSVSRANDSSDESSEGSKRDSYSRRRHKSPSPAKSKRRQVSRSPHSKHSQRRHSPYSSLETTRKRRSRSRSPIRRQRR